MTSWTDDRPTSDGLVTRFDPDFDDEPEIARTRFLDNFYRCPNTGEWVYKFLTERLILARKDHSTPENTASLTGVDDA